jgi:hypothetical protein
VVAELHLDIMTKVLLVAVAELIKVAVPLQVLLWADAAVRLLLAE